VRRLVVVLVVGGLTLAAPASAAKPETSSKKPTLENATRFYKKHVTGLEGPRGSTVERRRSSCKDPGPRATAIICKVKLTLAADGGTCKDDRVSVRRQGKKLRVTGEQLTCVDEPVRPAPEEDPPADRES
jgi:hypothetical protein